MRRIAVSFRNGLPAGTIQAFTPTASDSDNPFPLCPAGPQPSVKLGQAQQGQDGVLRLHKKDEYHASEGAFNLTQTSGIIHVFNFTTTSGPIASDRKNTLQHILLCSSAGTTGPATRTATEFKKKTFLVAFRSNLQLPIDPCRIRIHIHARTHTILGASGGGDGFASLRGTFFAAVQFPPALF